MSAAPVHFHPSSVYCNNLWPYHNNLINFAPINYCCGHKGTTMPERAGNTVSCGRIDPNPFAFTAGANPCWKMAGLSSSENPIPNGFRPVPLPYDYHHFFNITNPHTLDYYASQLIPVSQSSNVGNEGTDMDFEQDELLESKRPSGWVTQRQQRYHQRHHPSMNHPQATDFKNKARFSTTGLPSNYAIVRDTKMSLSSAPSSPAAGSLGSLGSNYHFVHPHMMPPSFGVPQYKGHSSSSSCCSTKDFKISSSSMSSYSSRSSMSSTPSSSGISPRKRCAEDANRGGYCRKNQQHVGERDSITLRCSCDSCAADDVTSKVDHVAITDGTEQQESKRSKNEEVVPRDSCESTCSSERSNKGRSMRKAKKPSKKRNHQKSKSSPKTSQNATLPTDFSFVAPRPFHESYVAGNGQVSGRYNLRSSVKGRKREDAQAKSIPSEPPSSNVHMVQSISPSCSTGSCKIDSNNNFAEVNEQKRDQIPRYHTRSRQKKVGADAQQSQGHKRNNRVEADTSASDAKAVPNSDTKEYHLASVIRRVPSSTILQLLKSQPSSSPPKEQSGVKNEDNARKLSTLKRLYDVHGVIGVGGGGTVHAGTRKSDGMQVAIKQVPKAKVKRWGDLDGRVVPIEFELLHKASRSGHAGVIRMLDWFERSNAYILVMERPQPVIDLFDYLNQSGALPEATARNIFRQIARAILHCHANGVIHRDIKDENVLLNLHTSEAKLIDFGCGTVMKSSPYTEFAGTPEFYPPEWFIHRSYRGQRVDAWSLGVLLYTMVEAEVPFQKEKDIMECKLHHKRSEQLSDECKNLIAWMLQKDQDLRPTIKQALEHPWFSKHDSPIRCVNTRKVDNMQHSGHPVSKLCKNVGNTSGSNAVQASSESPRMLT